MITIENPSSASPQFDLPERWCAVSGFGSDYDVSSLGRVRSHKRRRTRILSTPLSLVGRGRNAYRKAQLHKNGQPHDLMVHQLVCTAFHGTPESGQMVRHLDGDGLNNCASNLAWGTNSENQADSLRHGTNWQRNKTHCPRGHEYTADNTYWYRTGRFCRECHRLSDSRRRGTRAA